MVATSNVLHVLLLKFPTEIQAKSSIWKSDILLRRCMLKLSLDLWWLASGIGADRSDFIVERTDYFVERSNRNLERNDIVSEFQ